MLKRKIMALILGLTTMLTATATVHAEDTTEARETVRVGKYDCWVEDGEYYTVYEDEVWQVINLDEITPQSVSEIADSDKMLDWESDNFRVYLLDGKVYNGSIDISKSDDYTPIFVTEPIDNTYSFFMKTGFITKQTYNVTIFTYNNITNGWDTGYNTNLIFAVGSQSKKLFTGTLGQETSRCCVYFHKDRCDGKTEFNYSVYYADDLV